MGPSQLNSMECLDNSTLLIQRPSSLIISTTMDKDLVRVAILPSIIPSRLFISRLRRLLEGRGGVGVGVGKRKRSQDRKERERERHNIVINFAIM